MIRSLMFVVVALVINQAIAHKAIAQEPGGDPIPTIHTQSNIGMDTNYPSSKIVAFDNALRAVRDDHNAIKAAFGVSFEIGEPVVTEINYMFVSHIWICEIDWYCLITPKE